MSRQDDNKAIVGRWFRRVSGARIATPPSSTGSLLPDMLLQCSCTPRVAGRDDIKAFMKDFREAFPD